jgi:predicted aspartyl protease
MNRKLCPKSLLGHAFLVLNVAMPLGLAWGQSRAGVEQVTVPLYLDGNRPYIDLTFRKSDGSTRAARFVVDTGGGGFIITEPVARDIGLKWDKTMREEGSEFAKPATLPVVSLGDMPIELNPDRVIVAVGVERVLPAAAGGRPEGLFPGHLLAHYEVVLDYPKAKFTLARPGALKPSGAALPMPVSRKTGFPRTEIKVEGVIYGFLLDTGASFTMVSEELLKSWGSQHPDWPRHPGAFGEAKTLGGQTLETMFVPGAQWGTNALGEFGVTSQTKGTFENYMSQMMTAPITGSLAGNVLKHFRIELDYADQKLYLSTP